MIKPRLKYCHVLPVSNFYGVTESASLFLGQCMSSAAVCHRAGCAKVHCASLPIAPASHRTT
jgi:hypothetical protein